MNDPISIPLDIGYLHSGEEIHQLGHLHLEYDIEDGSSAYLTVTNRQCLIVGTLRLPNEALDKLAIHWLRGRGYKLSRHASLPGQNEEEKAGSNDAA